MTNTENMINIKRVISKHVISSVVERSITVPKDFSTSVLRTFARNDKSAAFWSGGRNDISPIMQDSPALASRPEAR